MFRVVTNVAIRLFITKFTPPNDGGAHLADSVRKKASKALRQQLVLPRGTHTILVAISGGKDSAVLLERIHENLGQRRDVTIVGGCVDEGIEGYRPPSLECARECVKS